MQLYFIYTVIIYYFIFTIYSYSEDGNMEIWSEIAKVTLETSHDLTNE